MRRHSPLAIPHLPALPVRGVDIRHQLWASDFLHLQPMGSGRGYSAWGGIRSLCLGRRQFGVNIHKCISILPPLSFKINKPTQSEKTQFIPSTGVLSGRLQNQADNASIYQHLLVSYLKIFLHKHEGQTAGKWRELIWKITQLHQRSPNCQYTLFLQIPASYLPWS